MEKFPLTKITLKIDNTEHIIRRLINFEIDIGFIEGNCYADDIEVLPWLNDELIIVAPTQHPLSKKKNISPKNLHTFKWILREPGSGTREIFEKATGHFIKPFLELGNTEAIKQAVQAGLGVSCLSKIAVAGALKNGNLIELKASHLKLNRQFYIVLHKNKYKTATLNVFSQRISSSIKF